MLLTGEPAMSAKRCTLVMPETGKKIPAEIIFKDKLRITVKPEGTDFEIFLSRGDNTIPYRGRFQGQYFTVHLE